MPKKALILALLFSAGADSETAGDAHALLEKAKATGFNAMSRDEAEAMLAQAVNIWTSLGQPNSDFAQSLVLLGVLRNAKQRGAAVEPLYSQATEIYDRGVPPQDPGDVALALELDAESLEQFGSLEKSSPLRRRAMQIRTKHIEDLLKDAPEPPPGQIVTGLPTVLMAPRPDDAASRVVGEFRATQLKALTPVVASLQLSSPVVVSSPEPAFDEISRLIKQQGTVYFSLVVGMDGRPYRIHLMRSAGFGLDERCLLALESWRFDPAKDGTGRAWNSQATVQFNLHTPY